MVDLIDVGSLVLAGRRPGGGADGEEEESEYSGKGTSGETERESLCARPHVCQNSEIGCFQPGNSHIFSRLVASTSLLLHCRSPLPASLLTW